MEEEKKKPKKDREVITSPTPKYDEPEGEWWKIVMSTRHILAHLILINTFDDELVNKLAENIAMIYDLFGLDLINKLDAYGDIDLELARCSYFDGYVDFKRLTAKQILEKMNNVVDYDTLKQGLMKDISNNNPAVHILFDSILKIHGTSNAHIASIKKQKLALLGMKGEFDYQAFLRY
jgi:hypothetical protein